MALRDPSDVAELRRRHAHHRSALMSFVVGASWSAAFKNSHIVLSNGNLTATGSGTAATHFAGRSAAVIATGSKRYWEITVVAGTAGFGVGAANALETYADGDFLGGQANGISYFSDGSVYSAGGIVATLAAYVLADVVGVAVDSGNKIWFRVNGGGWNNDIIANQNPATNTGGISIAAMGNIYPAYNLWNGATNTARFVPPFSFAAPSGFTTLS